MTPLRQWWMIHAPHNIKEYTLKDVDPIFKGINDILLSLHDRISSGIGTASLLTIFILQSVHLLYKYAIRIHVCFIRTRRINFVSPRRAFQACFVASTNEFYI
jgi:hypothetical protein